MYIRKISATYIVDKIAYAYNFIQLFKQNTQSQSTRIKFDTRCQTEENDRLQQLFTENMSYKEQLNNSQ